MFGRTMAEIMEPMSAEELEEKRKEQLKLILEIAQFTDKNWPDDEIIKTFSDFGFFIIAVAPTGERYGFVINHVEVVPCLTGALVLSGHTVSCRN